MSAMNFTIYESPFGSLILSGGPDGLRQLRFPGPGPGLNERDHEPNRFRHAVSQLDAWFAGERRTFELPLVLEGTPFQRAVWAALQRIPYGVTTTYGGLARELGDTRGGGRPEPRAVAFAVARTPVPIVIPCHRVLGADGSLTGYLGGVRRKRALLDFEAAAGSRGALDASWSQRQLALL